MDAKLHDRPIEQDDKEALVKLQEWFGTGAETQAKRVEWRWTKEP